MMDTDFLAPACRTDKLDIVAMRRGILRKLGEQLPKFEGVLLDIGCGEMPYKPLLTRPPSRVTRYIGLDVEQRPGARSRPDITWTDGRIPLAEGSVDCAISTEVFEHCPDPEAVMREIHRVLKANGLLFFTVPFVWPLHERPNDHYRFTPYSLNRHLVASGFTEIQLSATGGWDASLAQMLGLWVRRRQMVEWKRALLSRLLQPLIYLLLRSDRPRRVGFYKLPMMIGMAGTARKAPRQGPGNA